MARIRRSDERLDPEFSHDEGWGEDDAATGVFCPGCEDVEMAATNGTSVWRCPDCGYSEMRET